ncbi:MAG: M81 family metallopeptidase [Dongiaceae bacterium]
MKRLAVARLWHEGNSFSPVPTRLADFRRREWCVGDAAREFYRGTATELGAVVAFAEQRSDDWEVAFLPCMAAPPAGPVPDDEYELMAGQIVDAVRTARADAIYLSLHGALVTANNPTPERDLIRAVRAAVPSIPIGVSFDFHANFDDSTLDGVVVASGYQTYPHLDMAETASRTIAMLIDAALGRTRPVRALRKLPVVLASHHMRTDSGPMAELMALARAAEAESGILPGIMDVAIFGGFAYGDSPCAGPTVMVHADADGAAADDVAGRLAAEFTARLPRFRVSLPTAADGIEMALAGPPGPIAVIDPADNPMSGGIGDTPELFRALLQRNADVPTVYAFFCDPALVSAAHEAGDGATLKWQLGGRLSRNFGSPVPVTAIVRRLTDGRFQNRGPMERGLAVDLGRTCVLDIAGIAVIVTETCQSPNDRAYFDLHGIDLETTRLLCAKAKNHFRAAFGPICRQIVEVDCSGPAAADLSRLPFRHLRPGIVLSAA